MPHPSALAVLMAAAPLAPRIAFAQSGHCTVSATRATLTGLRVAPGDGATPFELSATSVPLVSTIEPSGLARIHVESPVAFDAVTAAATLYPTLASPLDVAGVLHLAAGQELVDPRARGDRVDVRVVPQDGVRIELRLPCSALALDDAPDTAADGSTPAPTGQRWRVQVRELRVYASPGTGEPLVVHVDGDPPMIVRERRARGGWIEIGYEVGAGSRIDGWVEAPSVTRTDTDGDRLGVPGRTLLGRGAWGLGPTAYEGPATVTAGTPVSADHGSGVWGVVRNGAGMIVVHEQDTDWVAIRRAPGIGGFESAPIDWVPFAAVQFPAGVVRRGAPASGAPRRP